MIRILVVLALIAVASAQIIYSGYPGVAHVSPYSSRVAVPSVGGGYTVHGASPHYGGVTYWR